MSKNETANKETVSEKDTARVRLAETGRNDVCPCGSGKKYKKCHLQADESASAPAPVLPDPATHTQNGWRLFEQRRPGAAEKEFRAALALKADLVEAQVGVGLAKLSSGDADGARQQLSDVVKAGDAVLADLRGKGVKDAFTKREAQHTLRASHALGCLSYDQDRFEESVADLERVYAIDEGPVGTEARLIAAKALMKLKRPADAVAVLEPASKSASGPGRGFMGLALAHFVAGDRAAAEAALAKAHELNPYFAKAVLGHVRKPVDNPLAATPGSREEATVYAQTYGDVWEEGARAFLEESLQAEGAKAKAGKPAVASDAPSAG